MMENERSAEEPFLARESHLLLADVMLSACSAARPGGVCSSPALLVLNSVPGSLRLPSSA